jgi:putative transposase
MNEKYSGYKSNNNIVYSCKYHVVWTTKYRRPVLVNGVDTRLKELIQLKATEMQCEVLELEVQPDHIHLLIEVDPQFGIHKALKRIKGATSHDLRNDSRFKWLKSRLPTLWTNSYFVSTLGGASLDVVKRYIQNQEWSAENKDG